MTYYDLGSTSAYLFVGNCSELERWFQINHRSRGEDARGSFISALGKFPCMIYKLFLGVMKIFVKMENCFSGAERFGLKSVDIFFPNGCRVRPGPGGFIEGPVIFELFGCWW